jgi:hypothetical protein
MSLIPSRAAARRADLTCTRGDFKTLYPGIFAQVGIERCKLQMLRTNPQSNGWKIGPMLAAGLTLRHYENFRICPSLQRVRERIAPQTPLLDEYGIHVLLIASGGCGMTLSLGLADKRWTSSWDRSESSTPARFDPAIRHPDDGSKPHTFSKTIA